MSEAKMRVDLRGLFHNIARAIPSRERDYYSFCLDEVYRHLQETVRGDHTLAEFSDHYCLRPLPPDDKVAE